MIKHFEWCTDSAHDPRQLELFPERKQGEVFDEIEGHLCYFDTVETLDDGAMVFYKNNSIIDILDSSGKMIRTQLKNIKVIMPTNTYNKEKLNGE